MSLNPNKDVISTIGSRFETENPILGIQQSIWNERIQKIYADNRTSLQKKISVDQLNASQFTPLEKQVMLKIGQASSISWVPTLTKTSQAEDWLKKNKGSIKGSHFVRVDDDLVELNVLLNGDQKIVVLNGCRELRPAIFTMAIDVAKATTLFAKLLGSSFASQFSDNLKELVPEVVEQGSVTPVTISFGSNCPNQVGGLQPCSFVISAKSKGYFDTALFLMDENGKFKERVYYNRTSNPNVKDRGGLRATRDLRAEYDGASYLLHAQGVTGAIPQGWSLVLAVNGYAYSVLSDFVEPVPPMVQIIDMSTGDPVLLAVPCLIPKSSQKKFVPVAVLRAGRSLENGQQFLLYSPSGTPKGIDKQSNNYPDTNHEDEIICQVVAELCTEASEAILLHESLNDPIAQEQLELEKAIAASLFTSECENHDTSVSNVVIGYQVERGFGSQFSTFTVGNTLPVHTNGIAALQGQVPSETLRVALIQNKPLVLFLDDICFRSPSAAALCKDVESYLKAIVVYHVSVPTPGTSEITKYLDELEVKPSMALGPYSLLLIEFDDGRRFIYRRPAANLFSNLVAPGSWRYQECSQTLTDDHIFDWLNSRASELFRSIPNQKPKNDKPTFVFMGSLKACDEIEAIISEFRIDEFNQNINEISDFLAQAVVILDRAQVEKIRNLLTERISKSIEVQESEAEKSETFLELNKRLDHLKKEMGQADEADKLQSIAKEIYKINSSKGVHKKIQKKALDNLLQQIALAVSEKGSYQAAQLLTKNAAQIKRQDNVRTNLERAKELTTTTYLCGPEEDINNDDSGFEEIDCVMFAHSSPPSLGSHSIQRDVQGARQQISANNGKILSITSRPSLPRTLIPQRTQVLDGLTVSTMIEGAINHPLAVILANKGADSIKESFIVPLNEGGTIQSVFAMPMLKQAWEISDPCTKVWSTFTNDPGISYYRVKMRSTVFNLGIGFTDLETPDASVNSNEVGHALMGLLFSFASNIKETMFHSRPPVKTEGFSDQDWQKELQEREPVKAMRSCITHILGLAGSGVTPLSPIYKFFDKNDLHEINKMTPREMDYIFKLIELLPFAGWDDSFPKRRLSLLLAKQLYNTLSGEFLNLNNKCKIKNYIDRVNYTKNKLDEKFDLVQWEKRVVSVIEKLQSEIDVEAIKNGNFINNDSTKMIGMTLLDDSVAFRDKMIKDEKLNSLGKISRSKSEFKYFVDSLVDGTVTAGQFINISYFSAALKIKYSSKLAVLENDFINREDKNDLSLTLVISDHISGIIHEAAKFDNRPENDANRIRRYADIWMARRFVNSILKSTIKDQVTYSTDPVRLFCQNMSSTSDISKTWLAAVSKYEKNVKKNKLENALKGYPKELQADLLKKFKKSTSVLNPARVLELNSMTANMYTARTKIEGGLEALLADFHSFHFDYKQAKATSSEIENSKSEEKALDRKKIVNNNQIAISRAVSQLENNFECDEWLQRICKTLGITLSNDQLVKKAYELVKKAPTDEPGVKLKIFEVITKHSA